MVPGQEAKSDNLGKSNSGVKGNAIENTCTQKSYDCGASPRLNSDGISNHSMNAENERQFRPNPRYESEGWSLHMNPISLKHMKKI